MFSPIPKYINLDFSQESNDEVVLSQYDKNSRQIIVKLYNNGVAWNELDTSTVSTMTVKIFASKPDNTNIFEDVSITGTNEVTMLLSDQFSTADGTVKAKITIYDSNGEKVLSPLSFTMHVDAAPFSEDAIVSTDSFSALDEMILNVQNLTVNIPIYVTRSETAATNAETSETNAQTYMTNAQTSETNASTYATNALAYATNSLNSAINSANSATSASNSATSAANSAIQAINTVNAEIVEATGTVTDSIIAPLEIAELRGKSVQATNPGTNHFKTPFPTSLTGGGVIITTNSDGSVKLEGVATTGFVSNMYMLENQEYLKSIAGQSVHFMWGSATPLKFSFVLREVKADGTFVKTLNGLTKDNTFILPVLTDVNNRYAVVIWIESAGNTYNDLLYPMLKLSSDTDNNWYPYCGDVASPNPNYPQTITNTGDNPYNLLIKDATTTVSTTPLNIPLSSSSVTDYDKVYLDVDGLWKKLTKVGTIIFNGTESWAYNSTSQLFYIQIPDAVTMTSPQILSSHYTYYTNIDAVSYGTRMSTTGGYVHVKHTGITTVADYKTWLSTHNVTLKYPLATPTIEVLSDELQISLSNLMSLDGTMTVTTDDVTNPDVVFRYARNSITAKKVMENSKRIRTNERDISSLETTVGTAALTTTDKTLVGGINELDLKTDNWTYGSTTNIDGAKIQDASITGSKIASKTIGIENTKLGDMTNMCTLVNSDFPNTYEDWHYVSYTGAYQACILCTALRVDFTVGDRYLFMHMIHGTDGSILTCVIRYYYTDGTWTDAGATQFPIKIGSLTRAITVDILNAPNSDKQISYISYFIQAPNDANCTMYIRQDNLSLRKIYDVKLLNFNNNVVPSTANTYSIGTSTSKWATAYFTNAITTSDERKKNTMVDFNENIAVDLINAMKPITYYYNKDESPMAYDKLRFGFGARTTESAINNMSSEFGDISADKMAIIDKEPMEDEKDFLYGMCYTELIAPMVKVEQYLLGEIAKLKTEIELLKSAKVETVNDVTE